MMRKLRVCLLAAAALAAILSNAERADALPAYSFETILPGGGPPGPDGFFGLGAAVTQDTIGATNGLFSMKYVAGAGGFVGARTEIVPPIINNPPGVQSIVFDMRIDSLLPELTFADIGVTIFGHEIDGGVFGLQNQFTDTVSIVGLGVGQHTDLVIDLDSDFFTGESFNEIYGDDVSDLDVASAFQFYISKTAGVPVTVYIDNVRTVVPEPTTGLLFGIGAIVAGLSRRRQG
jgi:hypothetical protein